MKHRKLRIEDTMLFVTLKRVGKSTFFKVLFLVAGVGVQPDAS